MADGGVSIAVRLKYSGKQARVPSCDLLQEGEKTVDHVECQARSPVNMSRSRSGMTITVPTARTPRSFTGGAPCLEYTVT